MNTLFVIALMAVPTSPNESTPGPARLFSEVRTATSISEADLAVTTRVQSETLRVGEPLLVTVVLHNVSRTLQFIPADVIQISVGSGWMTYALLTSDGQEYYYHSGRDVIRIWPASNSFPVPPGESVYARQLIWTERFFHTQKRSRFVSRPGEYRLVSTVLMPQFDSCGRTVVHYSKSDTAHFVVRPDAVLQQELNPAHASLLKMLDYGPSFAGRPATNAAVAAFSKQFARSGPLFPYYEFLVPGIIGLRSGQELRGLDEARAFILHSPNKELAEEMSFDQLDFLNGLGERARLDSTVEALVKSYPRNLHAVIWYAGHDLWESTEHFCPAK